MQRPSLLESEEITATIVRSHTLKLWRRNDQVLYRFVFLIFDTPHTLVTETIDEVEFINLFFRIII